MSILSDSFVGLATLLIDGASRDETDGYIITEAASIGLSPNEYRDKFSKVMNVKVTVSSTPNSNGSHTKDGPATVELLNLYGLEVINNGSKYAGNTYSEAYNLAKGNGNERHRVRVMLLKRHSR